MISWINYEKETRLEHMAKLMEHVRLPLLPRDYLVQVSAVLCEEPSTSLLTPASRNSSGQPWLYGVLEEFYGSFVCIEGTNPLGYV